MARWPLLVAVKPNVSSWPIWMSLTLPAAEPCRASDGTAGAGWAGLVSTVTSGPATSTEPRIRANLRTLFGRVVMADGNSPRDGGPGPGSLAAHVEQCLSIWGGGVRVAGERIDDHQEEQA
jgi:hypothetical protein